MRDVAERAGVSVATVSHVINDTRFVSEKIRARVMEAVKKLGYSPDAIARIFKTGRKNLIGFIVPDIANSFFSTMIEVIEHTIDQSNYKIIIVNTKETKSREIDNIRVLTSGVVDGLIVASTLTDYREIRELVPEGFPMVFIDRIIKDCPHDTITISNYDAIYESVVGLIKKGHGKIGYIAGLRRLSTTSERLAAYAQALKDNGLPYRKTYIQFADSMADSAYRSTEALIQEGCDALLVSNNVMTIDALCYLTDHGIWPNRDIDIVGYAEDDRDLYPKNWIDHIVQPTEEMARLAGERMLERIKSPGTPKREIVLDSALVFAGVEPRRAAFPKIR